MWNCSTIDFFFSYILYLTSYTRQKNNSFSDFDYHRRHFQKSLKGKIVWRAKELCSHISCIFLKKEFSFFDCICFTFFQFFFRLLKLQLLLLWYIIFCLVCLISKLLLISASFSQVFSSWKKVISLCFFYFCLNPTKFNFCHQKNDLWYRLSSEFCIIITRFFYDKE